MTQRPYIVGNWKMNGNKAMLAEARAIDRGAARVSGAEVAIAPPFPLIGALREAVGNIGVGGQDCHAAVKGAHTGDVSAVMLADAGADFVIVGTGFVTDLALRPELAHVEASIARWADRFVPPPADRHEDLLRHPYLGPHFEFTERVPGSAPELRFLFNYTFGSLASLGFGGANISGMKYSIPRLVRGVTGSLFAEDRDHHFASLQAFAEEEF